MAPRSIAVALVLFLWTVTVPVPIIASAQQTLTFENTWGGLAEDRPSSVATDQIGNIYLAGESRSFGWSAYSLFLLKYDPSGHLVWERSWGNSDGSGGLAGGVVVDAQGNIVVAGVTSSPVNDILLLKLDSSGNLVWQRVLGESKSATGSDVSVDSLGNIYIVGSLGNGYSDDVLVLKLDPDGNVIWQKSWAGTLDDDVYGGSLDDQGNLYVAGTMTERGYRGHPVRTDDFVLKFDPDGQLLWQSSWEGLDSATAITADRFGNIYVTGRSSGYGSPGSTPDLFLLRLYTGGDVSWLRTWGSSGSDGGQGVAVDLSGEVYIVGETGWTGDNEVIILNVDPSGNLQSERTWGSNNYDYSSDITVDSSSNLFAIGSTREPPPYTLRTPEIPLSAHTPNATQLSSQVFDATLTSSDPGVPLGSPQGLESFAGIEDAFLIKLGVQPSWYQQYWALILTGAVAATVAGTVFVIYRKRIAKRNP